jgi:hypothetical protein
MGAVSDLIERGREKMQVVLNTGSLAVARSARFALLAADIEAELVDEIQTTFQWGGNTFRVAVPEGTDLGLVQGILHTLEEDTPELPSWKWHKRAVRSGTVGVVLFISAGARWSVEKSSELLTTLGFALGVLLMVIGLVFYVVGNRADAAADAGRPEEEERRE